MNPFNNRSLPDINMAEAKKELEKLFKSYRYEKYVLSEDTPFISRVEKSVERLPMMEKDLIQSRYLDCESDYRNDTLVMDMLMISKPIFYKIRSKSLYKLAFSLGIYDFTREDIERVR